MSWSDDKKLSLRADAINRNSLKKKKKKKSQSFILIALGAIPRLYILLT